MDESRNQSQATIEQYIKTFPKETQLILTKIRQVISNAAPDAVETISYGIPTFKLNGRYLIYFAGYKNHVSLYPISTDELQSIKELQPYQSGKGTAKFPLDKAVPYDMISKIVELKLARRNENL